MYALLLVLIVVALFTLKTKEHFGLHVWGNDWYNFDSDGEGYEVFNMFPNTCPPDRPDKDAGLCYPRCRQGFHGVGPVCWADSVGVGVGVPVGLNPCPDGWNNDGLTCRENIYNDCSWQGLFDECWGKLSGGKIVGRLNPYCPKKHRIAGDGYDTSDNHCKIEKTRGVCEGPGSTTDDHPDYVNGLCYRKCPADLPARIPGMPYLCYKGEGLSYGRGVGRIPSVVRIANTYNPI